MPMKLNYKTYGKGYPLIILHGLLGSLDNWATLAKKFAENYTVFVIDQRNHGKSPHSNNFNYEILANDLLEFMDEHHIYSANILGHSMGGKTAMLFALENPDKINKLIIADIAPVNYNGGHEIIFQALLKIDLKSIKSRKEVDDLLEKDIKLFSIRQFLMKGLTRNKEREFVWKYNLKGIWNAYQEIIKSFQKEDEIFEKDTLFIKGENSNYILDEYLTDIEKYFPNYKLKTIDHAGHWLHAEKPTAFYTIVSEFLQ